MRLARPLVTGRLLRRYKRFLADVALDPDGEEVTAHTANPGAMLGLVTPGSPVVLSVHDDPKRKLRYSWELVRPGRAWVGINPLLANDLVEEGVRRGVIGELRGYDALDRERRAPARPGAPGSRIDLRLTAADRPPCWVEVKNVTLLEGRGALFPDAVSERGRKHLEELTALVEAGARAVLCFVVQRADARWAGPADAIDPRYGEALRAALEAGVEVVAYRARVRATRGEVALVQPLPLRV